MKLERPKLPGVVRFRITHRSRGGEKFKALLCLHLVLWGLKCRVDVVVVGVRKHGFAGYSFSRDEHIMVHWLFPIPGNPEYSYLANDCISSHAYYSSTVEEYLQKVSHQVIDSIRGMEGQLGRMRSILDHALTTGVDPRKYGFVRTRTTRGVLV